MTTLNELKPVSLYISSSSVSTEVNKTGSWRFVRPSYQYKTAPCSVMCPTGEDIPKIEMLSAKGNFKEAWETILKENPLPSVCGRVCFHTCETACNRNSFDEGVSIHSLERFIGDMAISEGFKYPLNHRSSNGKKAAIIGSGPAGLSNAYFLSMLGYSCEIFEEKCEAGGLLRWGIPGYRLPIDILEKEIARIKEFGVQIHCNISVTKDFFNKLKDKFDAIFIGTGHGLSQKMGIPGEEFAKDGLNFLYRVKNKEVISLDGQSAVIGGGNAAVDVARSLIRFNIKPVIFYRRRKIDMPAFLHEVEMAEKEGVEISPLCSPISISKDGDEYTLLLQKMKISGKDEKGRQKVIPDNGNFSAKVKNIFSAIGSQPDVEWNKFIKKSKNIRSFSHCSFVNENKPIIFGGDLANQTKSVSDAIFSGKQGAIILDIFFNHGLDLISQTLDNIKVGEKGNSLSMEMYIGGDRKERSKQSVSYDEINLDYFTIFHKSTPSSIPLKESISSFSEIERPLTKNVAIKEAVRCFNCGICNECDNCRIFCPDVAVLINNNKRYINLDYCKGCGICVVECPRDAMILTEEI